MVLLLLLCAAKACWYIVEQPSSSLMEYHVLFQRLLKLVQLKKIYINMGDFGSPTLRPTILYSSGLAMNPALSDFVNIAK